jgi:hypothetical protein
LIIWGPEFVVRYFTSSDITAEKLSIVVIGIGVLMMIYGKKKQNQI